MITELMLQLKLSWPPGTPPGKSGKPGIFAKATDPKHTNNMIPVEEINTHSLILVNNSTRRTLPLQHSAEITLHK